MYPAPQPSVPVQPGDLVAEKYRVERVLAQGGMGIVVVARHEALDQRVAIKLLLPGLAATGPTVARFVREAQAAARIQSEHVCRVFDVGTMPGGAPYMVMELLDGADLGAELERRGTLPPVEAAGYAVEALDAIVEAHRRGVVHRDLKPSNLFLARRDDGRVRVKVLDFGISKVEAPEGASPGFKLTSTNTLLGSPAYMSPEQVRSAKGVDARTDVWAMGVILYECLAGGTLFSGETLGEVFARIREDPIPPVSSRSPRTPPELEAIVMRCLARKPDERFQTAAELRDALASFVAQQQGTPAPRGLSIPPSSEVLSRAPARTAISTEPTLAAPGAIHSTAATWAGSRSEGSRGRVWAGAGLALAAGAVGVYLLLGRATPAPTATSDPAPASIAPAPPTVSPQPATTVVPASPASAPAAEPAPSASAAPATSASAHAPPRPPAPKASARKPAGGLDDILGRQH